MKDVFNITQGDEQGIVEAVANVGPVSIAFEVSGDFRFYVGGIYSSDSCHKTSDKVNHAVSELVIVVLINLMMIRYIFVPL